MTPEELEANAGALQQVFAELGVTPLHALMAEGRQRGYERFGAALDRAAGQPDRIAAIEARVERDAATHARREMARLSGRGGIGSDAVAAPPPMPMAPATMMPQPATFQPVAGRMPAPAPAPQPNALLAPSLTEATMPVGIDYGTPPGRTPPLNALMAADTDLTARAPRDELYQSIERSRDNPLYGTRPWWAEAARTVALEGTGIAPAQRAGAAFAEGDYLLGAGNAATAAIPYRPMAGLGALGATYGAALATDLGLVGGPSAATAQQPKRAPPAATPPPDDGLTPALRARRTELQRRLQREGDDMALPLQEELNGLNRLVAEHAARQGRVGEQAAVADRVEYDRAVQRAEAARATERARDTRFQDTNVGRLWQSTGGVAPVLAGALTGVLSRAATGGARPLVYNYLLPGAEGALAGATAYNIPLAYDAFLTPVENPERRATEAYVRELPPNHPRRPEALAALADPNRLPEANPVRRIAAAEFYDPWRMGERVTTGGIEGLLAGVAGANTVRMGGRIRTGGPPQAGPPGPAAPPGQQGPLPPGTPPPAQPVQPVATQPTNALMMPTRQPPSQPWTTPQVTEHEIPRLTRAPGLRGTGYRDPVTGHTASRADVEMMIEARRLRRLRDTP